MAYLTDDQKTDFLQRGFSRRAFGRIGALLGAGAAGVPLFHESAMAQLSMIGSLPDDAVKINANENPMGPCAEALEAMSAALRDGGRYRYEEAFHLARTLAAQEGLRPEYVRAFAGSSDPLHRSVLAFTSPARSYVTADPGYEAGFRAAEFVGARAISVPLTKNHAHDVKAMAKADPNAGLIYLCNPNNPTGTLTSRADIEWLVANKPSECIILLDEAYLHISSNAVPCSDLVAADKEVIVLRTFSKLYGMAGLRAGAALARPDLLEKIGQYGAGGLPVTAMVGARASLLSKTVVPERRRVIGEVRADVLEFLDKQNFSFTPSESNKFMVDVRRPGYDVVRAMAREKIYIGRVWPAWPTHVRVSIGTKAEMDKFKAAFLKVMSA